MIVLRPGALGDSLLAVPALRALRAPRPETAVTFGAHAGAARLLAALGEIERGLSFDARELAWVFRADLPRPADDVVAWITNRARGPGLVGARLVAASQPVDPAEHVAAYLVRTVAEAGLGISSLDTRPLGIRPVASAEILIHPGSGAPAKNWAPAHFAEVIRGVRGPVRLIVGEADAAAAAAVEAALGRPLPRLQHAALEDLAARLAGCRAYLGNDSGVSHLAGLSGARTISLFGPTSPTTWAPVGPRVQTLGFETSPADIARLLQR